MHTKLHNKVGTKRTFKNVYLSDPNGERFRNWDKKINKMQISFFVVYMRSFFYVRKYS